MGVKGADVVVLDATVIIPTFDRADLLQQTLSGLTRQDCRSFEVVVADDGSTDGTDQVVAAFADRLPIRYLFQPDLGHRVAAARNLGIRAASGDVCVMLDCGMLPGTGLVSGHVRVHRRSADRVAVVGYSWAFRGAPELAPEVIAAIDHRDVDASISRLAVAGPTGRDMREEYFYDRYGEDLSTQLAPWLAFWGCNISVRREDLFVVGLFDEVYRRWGFEDLDLGYRLFRAGLRFELCRAAAAVHVPHDMEDAAIKQLDTVNKRYFHTKFRNRVSELLLAARYNLEVNGLLQAEAAGLAARETSAAPA
ncbi:MAG TPA: glycosyltransferase [Mycobacteriales bacterium]|nr:glycosyltransferase [Mycobacteriales bacterium]